MPDPTSQDELLCCIRRSLTLGRARLTTHFRIRLAERGAGMQDVLRAVNKGGITEVHWEETRSSWRCTVQGTDFEGDELRIVCAVQEFEELVTLITLC
ncbi:MAG: DUF4258 domain-containing protein [Myxococcota bacterium]|jgi:hypothetical protein|nr:DUF4258 domain-containing protein [Myxococcota bacterium]